MLALELSPASAFTLSGTSVQLLTSGQFDKVYYRGYHGGYHGRYHGGYRFLPILGDLVGQEGSVVALDLVPENVAFASKVGAGAPVPNGPAPLETFIPRWAGIGAQYVNSLMISHSGTKSRPTGAACSTPQIFATASTSPSPGAFGLTGRDVLYALLYWS
jgi:hypothetical protein